MAQAVLLNVHRALPRYRPSGRVTTWVYRMTRNAAVDLERSARRRRARLDTLAHEVLAARLTHRPDALDLLGAADELRRFMAELSPQQRAVLDLIELQGFSASEVSEMLEITPATVRVHPHRARAALAGAGREATPEVKTS